MSRLHSYACHVMEIRGHLAFARGLDISRYTAQSVIPCVKPRNANCTDLVDGFPCRVIGAADLALLGHGNALVPLLGSLVRCTNAMALLVSPCVLSFINALQDMLNRHMFDATAIM